MTSYHSNIWKGILIINDTLVVSVLQFTFNRVVKKVGLYLRIYLNDAKKHRS